MAARTRKSAGSLTADQEAAQAGRALLSSDQTGETEAGSDRDLLYSMLGISGLTRFGGISRIYEEFLRELQGPQGMKNLREMNDNCPIAGAIFFAANHLTRGVTWRVKAKNASPEAQRAAALVETALFKDLRTTWPDTLSEIFSMLPFGWSVLEMSFKKRAGQQHGLGAPVQDDLVRMGSEPAPARSNFSDGLIGFDALELRSQETMFMWEFDTQSHATVLQQLAPPDYKLRRIPLPKCLHFKTQTAKNNPEGRSLLRNAWTSYYFRKNIQITEGIGVERDLVGYPVFQVKGNDPATGVKAPDLWNKSDAKASATLASMYAQIKRVRRDENEGAVVPPWAELKLLTSGGRRNFDTSGIITRYDQRIAMSLLADFIMLGHDAVGSKALASTKTSMFSAALTSFCENVCAQVNARAIALLMFVNGIPAELAPTLESTPVESIDLADLGDYIQKLSGAGMVLFPSQRGDLEAQLLGHAKLTSASSTDEEAITADPPQQGEIADVQQKRRSIKRRLSKREQYVVDELTLAIEAGDTSAVKRLTGLSVSVEELQRIAA